MNILLTGGAGFMGSNMIHFLLEHYEDVKIVNLDALTYAGNLENLEDLADDSRLTFFKGDITDMNDVEKAIQGADLVINYAAETHVDRSIIDPQDFLKTNIMGVYNLLEAVRKHKTSRFIHISTDEVYGEVLEGESDETSAFRPRSPYSASKAAGDHLCHAYAVTYGVPVIIAHSCNFYGPYQFPEKLVPLFISRLLEGKRVPLYGDGLQVREWIFTEDHCRAIDLIARHGKLGEVYNIGTGERYTNLELARKLIALMDRDESAIEFVKDRPGHDRRYALNANKLRTELGWQPLVKVQEGLKHTVEWYQDHPTWVAHCMSGAYMEYYENQYLYR